MLAAVLHGLPALRHLGLHGYREVALEQLTFLTLGAGNADRAALVASRF